MRPIVNALCTSLSLLAGVASAQTAPLVEEPAPGAMSTSINARGGEYHEFASSTFGSPLDTKVELSIERINMHPKWGARVALCVYSDSSDYQACIHASRRYLDRTELQVARTLYKDGGKTLVSSDPVPGVFKVGSTIAIGVRGGTDSVEFRVGDGPWATQALPFSPRSLRASCSSALCRISLQ